jgi:hypothetical protein
MPCMLDDNCLEVVVGAALEKRIRQNELSDDLLITRKFEYRYWSILPIVLHMAVDQMPASESCH